MLYIFFSFFFGKEEALYMSTNLAAHSSISRQIQETAVYQYTPDDIAVMDMSLLPPKNEERKRRALQAEGKGVIELVRK